MKITMLIGLSGGDFSLSPGDTTDKFDLDTAMRLIDSGAAKPASKKEYESKLAEYNKALDQKRAEEAKAKAALEKEAIELELNALYGEVVDKEAALAGVVLEDEQRKKLIEGLKNRGDSSNGKTGR